MTVIDCCQTNVMTISPDATAYDAANLMEEWNVGSIVVTENERPVGIVTDRDLVVRVLTQRLKSEEVGVREIMTPDPLVLKDDTGLYQVIKAMREKGVRRLPVVDSKNRLTGIITADDVIRLLVKEMSCISSTIERELPTIPTVV